jgi:antitoxin component of RelBE/YafQ-DinJ toxin-antitoxin module
VPAHDVGAHALKGVAYEVIDRTGLDAGTQLERVAQIVLTQCLAHQRVPFGAPVLDVGRHVTA